MRIAFYAPLKSPNHPVPSGDRQMARMLIGVLQDIGHQVEIASELRAFSASSAPGTHDAAKREAQAEIARIAEGWSRESAPDLWFCYHPYYKAPDFIGPSLVRQFGLPYITVEASYASRRAVDGWVGSQAEVNAAVWQAAVNICFRQKDRMGLQMVAPDARYEMLDPFIRVPPTRQIRLEPPSRRILTAAMMRPGDKLESYRMLARALERMEHVPWTLSVAGDGPCRDEVRGEFMRLDPARIEWLGEKRTEEMPRFYESGAIYAWPGFGEAYGLAYLEAQAAGLPVVAQDIDGVPGVVCSGETGILTPPGDVDAFADAIAKLLDDLPRRQTMSDAARRFVAEERSSQVAATRLAEILHKAGLK